jgi:YidC/Oxa1 family membrane protein insertase
LHLKELMETKRLFSMMLLCFAVIFGWKMYVEYLYSQHPEWKRPGATATTMPATMPTTIASTQGILPPGTFPTTVTPSSAPTMSAPSLRVMSATTQPATVRLGDESLGDKSPYRMIVNLSTQGAAVDSVTLPEFKAPDAKSKYIFQTPADPGDASTRSLATRSITVNGTTLDLVGADWVIEEQSKKSATFVLDCGLVKVRKIFELMDKSTPGQGYELVVRHTIENRTPAKVNVSVAFSGPTMPPRESERGPDLQTLGGYDAGYEKVTVDHHMVEEFSTKAPEKEITKGADNAPLLWAGTSSVYFDALVRPEPLEPNTAAAKYIGNVKVTALNPESDPVDRHVVMTFGTTDLAIQPGASITLPSTVYFGPRKRQVLYEPHYATFPLSFDSTLVLTSGPCAYCTFQFLINGLVKLLAFFHFITRDWGLAIICLVVIVRLILHPITKRSQVSMMKMGKMGPEMERLKKKYADDKDELNKQMMLMYKEQGVGAYLGCLPMFLQMPIWIALWSALQSTFELRQSPFLYGFTWIHDLAKPDHLIALAKPIAFTLPLLGTIHFSGLNILPVLLAVVFFLQQKYTPKPPATTPEQETQQKMMLWMSVLLFPLIVYNGPAGLNLYILTSTTIGIIESKRIRDHIKQKEEEEKAGKIIVDAPKSMKKKRDDDDLGSGAKRTGGPRTPKTGLAGWIEQMQSKANELRKQAEKDRK